MKRTTGLALLLALCAALALPSGAGAAVPGGIEGRVTDASTGNPIISLKVCAYVAATESEAGCATTGINGEYLIEALESGSYKVEFEGSEPYAGYRTQWYNDKPSFAAADPVSVSEGSTTSGINAAMKEIGGRISGTVTDAVSGAPIAKIDVCAEGVQVNGSHFYGYGCGTTNSSGEYTIFDLLAGPYRVSFFSPSKWNEQTEELELEGPNYVFEYYNGKPHEGEADTVNVAEGGTTAGINAALQPGATITGTVTDAVTGAPLQGISACAWGAVQYYCDTTNAAGQYLIQTVAAGGYKVEFEPEHYFVAHKVGEPYVEHWQRSSFALMDYVRQYYNDKFTFAAAETITATAGGTLSGINAKMTKESEPPPPPGTAMVAPKAKVKGGKALLQIACQGSGPCKGNLSLAAKIKQKKRTKDAVIGKAAFGLPPGATETVAVKLSAKGLGAVMAAKHGLKAKVGGTGVAPGAVLLKAGSKRHHRHKGR